MLCLTKAYWFSVYVFSASLLVDRNISVRYDGCQPAQAMRFKWYNLFIDNGLERKYSLSLFQGTVQANVTIPCVCVCVTVGGRF